LPAGCSHPACKGTWKNLLKTLLCTRLNPHPGEVAHRLRLRRARFPPCKKPWCAHYEPAARLCRPELAK